MSIALQNRGADLAILISILARLHGTNLAAETLWAEFSDDASPAALVRLLRRSGFRARLVRVRATEVLSVPLPAIAVMSDGTDMLVAKSTQRRLLCYRPSVGQPVTIELDDFIAGWSQQFILASPRPNMTRGAAEFGFGWFLKAVNKHRAAILEVLGSAALLQVFALITPLAMQVVTDKVLVHHGMSTLDVVVVGLATVALFEAVLGGLRSYTAAHTGNRIDVALGSEIVRHLLSLPMTFFEARQVGESISRIKEVENIRQFLTGSSVTVATDCMFSFVFLGVMLLYSPWLTLLSVCFLPPIIAVSVLMTPVFQRRLREKFRLNAQGQSLLVEMISGVETVKAQALEVRMVRRWDDYLASYVRASFQVTKTGIVATQTTQFLSRAMSIVIIYFGARAVLDGGLSVGELIAFNMMSQRMVQPMLPVSQTYQDFQQARLSVERVGDVMKALPERRAEGAGAITARLSGEVLFQSVTFRYAPDGPLVLKNFDLEVRPGEIIGIVGPSGSGKSALAKLLQRLHTPSSGRVSVDGIDLGLLDPSSLRRQIGVVQQESFLFSGTIRENIAIGDPAMPLTEIIAAARLAGAHDFITSLPGGYETAVGERGASLSGGQRQRIAIARALMRNPTILVLDEATSALDYESEHAIQQKFAGICRGKTVFIIAHRLCAVRTADRILTIENGELVEQGAHDTLILSGGRYAALHALQSARRV